MYVRCEGGFGPLMGVGNLLAGAQALDDLYMYMSTHVGGYYSEI